MLQSLQRHRLSPRSNRSLFFSVTILSVALPIFIAWRPFAEFAQKPLGGESREYRWFRDGCIKNGELWYPKTVLPPELFPTTAQIRIVRLNLADGHEVETSIILPFAYDYRLTWIDGELYAFNRHQDGFWIRGGVPIPMPAFPYGFGAFDGLPFRFDDQLTMLVFDQEQECRLCHFADGKWKNGRRVVLPVYHTCPNDPCCIDGVWGMGSPATVMIAVLERDHELHAFVSDNHNYVLYRRGLELSDDEFIASGLIPENSTCLSSDWSRMPPEGFEKCMGDDSSRSAFWSSITADKHGVLFFSWHRETRLVRWQVDGRWVSLKDLARFADDENRYGVFHSYNASFLADSRGETAYLIHEGSWGRCTIIQVGRSALEPNALLVEGHENAYLRLWANIFWGMCLSAAIHFALVAAAGIFKPATKRADSDSEVTPIPLNASISKRVLARLLDLMLLITVLAGSIGLREVHNLFDPFGWSDDPVLFQLSAPSGDQLLDVEDALRRTIVEPWSWDYLEPRLQFVWRLFPASTLIKVHGDVLLATSLLLWTALVILEGRYGWTPGKWIMGLRVVSIDRGRSRFAQSVVRNLMLFIDFPLVSPLPAAMSMAFSPYSQRIGDRVAGTRVVLTARKSALTSLAQVSGS